MANVTVTSNTTVNGITTLKGKAVSGVNVVVKNGMVVLGSSVANNSGDWSVSFASEGITSVTVHGDGKGFPVAVGEGTGTGDPVA